MNTEKTKCVMVIDAALPLGIIANTAAILGVTLGNMRPQLVGPNATDKTGNTHLGIVQIPVPILKGSAALLRQMRETLYQPEYRELLVADFSDVAQSCHAYDAFLAKMSDSEEHALHYFGLALCGNAKMVNKLTGSIPLLR